MDARVTERPVVPADARTAATFALTHLDLYNWGPFVGRHCAQMDLKGTAVIGPTGSGKTTLVDALMTLLTHNPRYNLASTGGHESDRDLMSYVRGVSGPGNNSGDNAHITRPGKTVSGIGARFSDGERQLLLGALFWVDDTSMSAADLQKQWIFSEVDQQDLGTWLEVRHASGARGLRQLSRETAGLHITPNKQEYLSYVRRFFEVGDNAFNLLNRASGLKQLDSIDEIFRELVLDDTSRFERAAEVAKEFDDLTAIHNELETARQQQHSLQPVATIWQQRLTCEAQLNVQRELKALLPIWYAEHAYRLWNVRLEDLEDRIGEGERAINRTNAQIETLGTRVEQLRDLYMKCGGASIEHLRELLASQEGTIAQRRRHAAEYQIIVSRLHLDPALTAEVLAANQSRSLILRRQEKERLDEQTQEAWNLGAIEHRQSTELNSLQQELQQVRSRPGSNISRDYQDFRAALAEHLGVEESAVPFAAELVQVKAEEAAWRGAIERAIGGHRLRVMVGSERIEQALRWVNSRDNRLHVRLLDAQVPNRTAEFLANGFVRKLKFKTHPYRDAMKHLLADIDRHCVDSTEALYLTPYAMTREGTMSARDGHFEKKDQQPLHKGWMTGFDNKDRLAELTQQIGEADQALRQGKAAHERAKQAAELTKQHLAFVEQLARVVFSDIDVPGAEAEVSTTQLRLEALSDPDSDAQVARSRWQAAEKELGDLRKQVSENEVKKALMEKDERGARSSRDRAFTGIGMGLSDAQRELAAQHFPLMPEEKVEEFPDREKQAAEILLKAIERATAELADSEKRLVRAMEKAQKVDTGALAEAGTEMQDVPAYLERLRVLTEEALPEKLKRFLSYLNQSSDQGVTQLLTDIDNEVSMIMERIEDLNRTLRRVDFQPARYLRLEPQRIVHEILRNLHQKQRELRSAALKDDQGESHFRALRAMVDLLREASEKKKILGARALLDPRYRLEFSVSVIQRETGAVIETRNSSQGGSGGEKESIASYVLTASLSYALCPPGNPKPLFGTIVVDEAFSKSSRSVAGRIIGALSEFGLHPLFVTPNKELLLLRQHTRSAILIHRKGQQATMTSLSWEELEAHARERKRPPHEVPG